MIDKLILILENNINILPADTNLIFLFLLGSELYSFGKCKNFKDTLFQVEVDHQQLIDEEFEEHI